MLKGVKEQYNNRIVPLHELIEQIKNNLKTHKKYIKKLEKKLYKIRIGTLEGLARDTIAEHNIRPRNSFQKNLLNPPDSPNDPDYDEVKILFPEDVEKGGKRHVSRKYRNNRNKKIRKSKKK